MQLANAELEVENISCSLRNLRSLVRHFSGFRRFDDSVVLDCFQVSSKRRASVADPYAYRRRGRTGENLLRATAWVFALTCLFASPLDRARPASLPGAAGVGVGAGHDPARPPPRPPPCPLRLRRRLRPRHA